jgi:hypothetical protein
MCVDAVLTHVVIGLIKEKRTAPRLLPAASCLDRQPLTPDVRCPLQAVLPVSDPGCIENLFTGGCCPATIVVQAGVRYQLQQGQENGRLCLRGTR